MARSVAAGAMQDEVEAPLAQGPGGQAVSAELLRLAVRAAECRTSAAAAEAPGAAAAALSELLPPPGLTTLSDGTAGGPRWAAGPEGPLLQ